MFAAPMAAGTLLTFIPLEHIFFIDVITTGIGIATVFFCVKVPGIPRREKREVGIQTYVRDMGEGWRFIRSQPWMKTLFFASALFGILASPAAMLTPLQVARTFGDQVWRLTAINMAFSLGMMAGGILMSAWGGFQNKAHTMICAWLLFGMATVLFGVVSDFWVYTGIMTLCGSFMPMYNTPAMTIMHIRIPPQVMGRVFSVLMIINGLAMPLGMALFGPLGDRMKIELLLIVTGGMLCAGGILLSRSKALLQAGKALSAADPETDAEQKVIPPENPNAQDDMP